MIKYLSVSGDGTVIDDSGLTVAKLAPALGASYRNEVARFIEDIAAEPREEIWQEGYNAGYNEGYDEGYDEARNKAWAKGYEKPLA